MNDPGSMCGGQTVGDLYCDVEQLARRIDRSDRRPLDKLHDQVVRPNVVQLADVGMIQRGDCPSLTLKTFRKSLFVNLKGNGSIEARVAGFVHLAHATGSDGVHNLVGAAARSRSQ